MSLNEIFVPSGKITLSKVNLSARKHQCDHFSSKKLKQNETFQ